MICENICKPFVIGCTLFILAVATMSPDAQGQQTAMVNDSYQRYQQARKWFQEESYTLAYPVFKEYEKKWGKEDFINFQLKQEEVRFYAIACELMDQMNGAEDNAKAFMDGNTPLALKGQLAYYLGMYYFNQQRFGDAASAFDRVSLANLHSRQIATMNFARGYSLFTQKQFSAAEQYLSRAAAEQDSKYYADANYYYGLLLLNKGSYKQALSAFEISRQHDKYRSLVPYYSASIKYAIGQKEEALKETEAALANPGQFYDVQLKQLAGHAYFEKGDYAKARQYLEAYIHESEKIKREDLYELGYSYYQLRDYNKAIEQFKPLSGGQDTLSQDAMYLLGDAYLKTNQKANARNAFLFSADNSSNAQKRQISLFNYGKISYELGYDNDALKSLREYTANYPAGQYVQEANDLMVQTLLKTSNYREALELYESLLNKSDNARRLYPIILYNRAQQLINDKNFAAAETLINKGLSEPMNEKALPYLNFWKGELSYRNRDFSNAARYYNAFVANPVNDGDVNLLHGRFNLGYTYLEQDNYAAAQKEFAALENQRLTPALKQDVSLRLADALYMQRKYAEAKGIYNSVANAGGTGADYALYQLAMIDGAQNNPGQKMSRLSSLEASYPNSSLLAESLMEQANVHLATEQYAQALPYLKRIIDAPAMEGLKPAAYLKSGIALQNLDRDNEALSMLTTLIRQYPQSQQSTEALDNIRSIYVDQGRPDEYIKFANSIGRSVDESQADSLTYSAAELKLSDGKTAEANTALKDYLRRYPNGRWAIEATYHLAEIARKANKTDEALGYYTAIANKAPNEYAEAAMLQAARLLYFEKKDYVKAATLYGNLKNISTVEANKLEALRGLVRAQYYGKMYPQAEANARELLAMSGAGPDDKVFSNLILAKNAQAAAKHADAINHYKNVVSVNKGEPAAEARYEIARSYYELNNLTEAEKAAFETINKSGSYEWWVTKSYLLLGDIFYKQKDYFNAKATFKSVSENASFPELKAEATQKLKQTEDTEKANSKVSN